jgi:4-hydroxybenzoate polyprenyltransferase
MEQTKEEAEKLLRGLDAIRNYKTPLPVAKKKKSRGWLVFWIIVLVVVGLIGFATVGPIFILVIIVGAATESLWKKIVS